MADLIKRLQLSEKQYGVGMEENPFADKSPTECMTLNFGGGGSPPPPPPPASVTQQTSNIPEYFQPYLERLFERAEGVTTEPFQRYEGQRLAEITPEQQAAYQGVEDLVGGYKPYIQTADLLTAQASQQSTDPAAISSRMSPYQQAVIDIQKREALRDTENLQQQIGASAVGAGAYGGSRQALQETELARQTGQRLADIQATGSQQAYNAAMQQLAADRAASLAAGQQFSSLGSQQQSLGLAGLGALETVGGTKQGQEQKALDIAYEDFARETTQPSQQVQEMSSVLRGFNLPVSTYTTSQGPAPYQPGLGQQLLGAGLGVYGLGAATGMFKSGGDVQKFASGSKSGIEKGAEKYLKDLPRGEAFRYRQAMGLPSIAFASNNPNSLFTKIDAGEFPEDVKPGTPLYDIYMKGFRAENLFGPGANPDITESFGEQDTSGPSLLSGEQERAAEKVDYGPDYGPQLPPEDYETSVEDMEKPKSIDFKTGTRDFSNMSIEALAALSPDPNRVKTVKEQPAVANQEQETPKEFAENLLNPLREDIASIRKKYDSNVDLMKVEGKGMPKDLIAQIGLNLMTGDKDVGGNILAQTGSAVKGVLPEAIRRRERAEDKRMEQERRLEDQQFKLLGLEADLSGKQADIEAGEIKSRRSSRDSKQMLSQQIEAQSNLQKDKIASQAKIEAARLNLEYNRLASNNDYQSDTLQLKKLELDNRFIEFSASQTIEVKKLKLEEDLFELKKAIGAIEASNASEEQKRELRKLANEQVGTYAKYISDMGLDEDNPIRKSFEASMNNFGQISGTK